VIGRSDFQREERKVHAKNAKALRIPLKSKTVHQSDNSVAHTRDIKIE